MGGVPPALRFAVPVGASPYQDSVMEPPASPLTGEKCEGSQVDPKTMALNNIHGI